MKARPCIGSASILVVAAFSMATALRCPTFAQDSYLALAGSNESIELLRLSDFTKAAAINVAPMNYPALFFLPIARRLYTLQNDAPSLKTVLDFGACSGGLVRPLSIPAPDFIISNGEDTKLLIGSNPGAWDGISKNAVYVLDIASDTVTGTLGALTSGSDYITSVGFDPDRDELYLDGNIYDGSLTLIRQYLAPIRAGACIAQGKIYMPTGPYAEVYDPASGQQLTTIGFPGHGYGNTAVRTRAGDKVYVLTGVDYAHQGDPNFLGENTVAVIDTLTDQVSSIPLGRDVDFLSDLVLSADEHTAYIAIAGIPLPDTSRRVGSNALGVLDLQTGVLQQYAIDTTPTSGSLALIDKLGFNCGDGVIEGACGEQCDPPGSIVNGQVCDPNCTMGCGNGIASGSEQCDDGNQSNNDGCKNDCTWNICGDGVVYRGVEQCDHGTLNGTVGDACDAECHLPPRSVGESVAPGGTLTTDIEGDGATASGPVETWVTSPVGGSISIDEGAPDPITPGGYAFLGYSIHITLTTTSAGDPNTIVFEIHNSLLPEGYNQDAIEISKNGVLVDACTGSDGVPANPDPCVLSRLILADGNLRVTVLSATASYWGGLAPLHDAVVSPMMPLSVTIPAGQLWVSRNVRIKVRNADRSGLGRKQNYPIQLTTTNVDCPPGVIANVPDFDPRKAFAQDSANIAAGRTATASLPLTLSHYAFTTVTSRAPHRCTIKLTAKPLVVDNVDPNPSNNSVTLEINVVDGNDAPQAAGPEWLIKSVKPSAITIAAGRAAASKMIPFTLINPGAGAQPITVTAGDGDCPLGTITGVSLGAAPPGAESSATVKGGATMRGKVLVHAASAVFNTPNKNSPVYCTGTLTAAGAAADGDISNNVVKITLVVTDRNDLATP